MKVIAIQDAELNDCVRQAQRQRVVITRKGKPVALIIGVNGLDLEQVELGSSYKFWKQVEKWRQQPTITQEELDRRLAEWERRQHNSKPTRKKQKVS